MSVQTSEDTGSSTAVSTPDQRRWSRDHFRTVVGVVACGAAVSGAAAGSIVTVAVANRPTVVVATAAPFAGPRSGSSPTTTIGAVAGAVLPAVVAITAASARTTGAGAGVIVRSDGMVLTADHLIAQGGAITITLADGRTSIAHVVGRSPHRDLAVVKADKLRGLTPATFGSASDLRVGDAVLVIGNPLGFAGTVTSGIVSALHRSIPVDGEQPRVDPLLGTLSWPSPTAFIKDAIQTDAAINPGDSGGPLVDLRSHVVGIITTVVSTTVDDPDAGCGFAIPGDLAWATTIRLMSGVP